MNRLYNSTYLYLLAGFIAAFYLLPTGCTDPVEPPRKIKQSNLVYEDNVNGRLSSGNVKESTNFYYNPDGTLGRVTVYDDTTVSAALLKDVAVQYVPDSSKVVLFTFDAVEGYRTVELYYDNNKRISKLTDLFGNGLYFSYVTDRISRIRDSSGLGIVDFVNFIYDSSNNLLQYELSISGNPPIGRVTLEYSTNAITEELDTRFFNKDITFIYIGGLNLVAKLGLNFGLNNSNTLIKRTESEITTGTIMNVYQFGYLYNDNREIIKRNIRWNTDTLFYQFKY